MNYLKTIKAAKESQEYGLSRQAAANTCKLIKELAMHLYNWDLSKTAYAQADAIMMLADNLWNMYSKGY